MTDDLAEQLRDWIEALDDTAEDYRKWVKGLFANGISGAADEIETLTRRISVLEQALEPFATAYRLMMVPPKTAPKQAHEALEANDV